MERGGSFEHASGCPSRLRGHTAAGTGQCARTNHRERGSNVIDSLPDRLASLLLQSFISGFAPRHSL